MGWTRSSQDVPAARRGWLRAVTVPALAITLLVGVGGAVPASAGTKNPVLPTTPRPIVSGWIPYWAIDPGVASVQANADLFTDVVGFWHTATGKTSFEDQASDTARASAVAAIHGAGVRVLGGVTDSTGKGQLSAILSTAAGRTAHADALVALAVANGYDGIDLDYEGFAFTDGRATWEQTRPRWVAFVKTLSAKLHAEGLTLTVAVPVIYDSERSATSGYWVYDYAGIAPYVDRLRIMTYDYSVSAPGPIAPISWVRRVLDYAVSVVPAGKIQVGVPAYGRDWVTGTVSGVCPTESGYQPQTVSHTSREANALAASLGTTPAWDSVNAERTFTYTKTWSGPSGTCRTNQQVVFEEDRAAMTRARLVGDYQLGGIAQWTIGGEDRGQWDNLHDYARSIAKVSPRVELFAGDTTYGSGVRVHATVKWASGKPIANEDWTLSRRYPGSTDWVDVAEGKTSATGTVSTVRYPDRTVYWRLRVGGSWSRSAAVTSENRTLVHLRVHAALNHTTVRHGQSVRISGSIAPKEAGLQVSRERYLSGKWTVVATTVTGPNGGFSMSLTPGHKGTYTYRVIVGGSTTRAAGASPAFKLHVS